ncbi:hypothetical protein THOM_0610 [Trachipleistophora hominis]|uniref:Uncharacterized protein n=1 Tax=Trachipleistophora hominis TaxID=72359 RepID=L7JY73_TRAHO|nr:hypothetical protein THOM_0610 [Trachipleistophora hominis]
MGKGSRGTAVDDLSDFVRIFHKNINKHKKLEPKHFKRLSRIVRNNMVSQFLKLLSTFTNNECIVIGRAIMKNKMDDFDELVDFLVSRKSKYHIIILTCTLCKGRKLKNVDSVRNYIKSFFGDENGINFYKLIMVAGRKYRDILDDDILAFCRNNEHPILKEVLKEYESQSCVVSK